MPPIQTAAAMPGTTGWILAAELGEDRRRTVRETVLSAGRYVAAIERIDCDGCAAAVESALQAIRAIEMAGVLPSSSVLVFEVNPVTPVTVADLHEVLAGVSEAVRRSIRLTSLRGPLPSHFVSHSAA